MEKELTYYEVVKKLLGPIEPIGETNTDEKRRQNLVKTIDVVSQLIRDIRDVVGYKTRDEWSMKNMGVMADYFLKELKEE